MIWGQFFFIKYWLNISFQVWQKTVWMNVNVACWRKPKKTLLMLRKPKKNRKKQLMLNYIKSGFMPRYFCLVLAVSLWHPKFAIPDLIWVSNCVNLRESWKSRSHERLSLLRKIGGLSFRRDLGHGAIDGVLHPLVMVWKK